MLLFEWILALLLGAVVLAGLARRTGLPYPALLALAGAGVGFLPFAPEIRIAPDLALALFVAPVLLDAAFDTSPRDLRRYIVPLTSLVLAATLLTTAAVAYIGWRFGGLTLAAAIALGAIVAPPDAAAATAILNHLKPPRALMLILQGEGLLNDAIALLIYRLAVVAAVTGAGFSSGAPWMVLAALLSVPAGFVLARLYLRATISVRDPASATVLQFVSTFGVWLLAERVGLSAIVTMVAYAMTLAQSDVGRMPARTRVSSYSVWETVVFVLNVLAFVLMGLQARPILMRLPSAERIDALVLAGWVLLTVILVRVLWVMLHHVASRLYPRLGGKEPVISDRKSSVLVSWCGMRGLVTLATAFALPADIAGRDHIVLSAFAVVLGTLVLQGLSLKPLMRALRLDEDHGARHDISLGRQRMIRAAIDSLKQDGSVEATALRTQYEDDAEIAKSLEQPQGASRYDRLRLTAIGAARVSLRELWKTGAIGDDAFRLLQEELDWSELDAAPAGHFQPLSIEGLHPAGPQDAA
ncbi:MAG: NhaP-type Na+(K+)/H+ antiporter [Hydrocarboniphaga sp.]|uniref:cation:proton antiporter n=1 Tax=Hydrocarboniphaga sp. TaxID=2033016 RepID=UPI002613CAD4|nr:cation:proton antiporter [Hydrocarboniphaga sp.]MDB5971021.1 NhaP-type Na+(K+)/H+ antiporter [Hydrocarboniphaga sp.]